jgi:S1-C subfamily serine protease
VHYDVVSDDRPWLGVTVDEFDIGEGADKSVELVVIDVGPGSPASRAGLRRGDTLVGVVGSAPPSNAVPPIWSQVARLKAGATADLIVERDGATMRVPVRLASVLSRDRSSYPDPRLLNLGWLLVESSTELTVTSVEPDAPAAKAGIRGGDVVLRVGEQETRGLVELDVSLLKHPYGQPIRVHIRRDGRERDVMVPFPGATEAGRAYQALDVL